MSCYGLIETQTQDGGGEGKEKIEEGKPTQRICVTLLRGARKKSTGRVGAIATI